MPRLLSTLAGAAAVYGGMEAARKARKLEGRQDTDWEYQQRERGRTEEEAIVKQQEKRDEREAQARKASVTEDVPAEAAPAKEAAPGPLGTAKPGDAQTAPIEPAQGDATAGTQPLAGATLDKAPASPVQRTPATLSGQTPAAGPSATPPGPPKALWMKQAEAERDYWTKEKKRPDRGNKAMLDAIKQQQLELQVYNDLKLGPQKQTLREKGLSLEGAQQDQSLKELQMKMADTDITMGGLLWGQYLMGDRNGAIEGFNKSNIVQPGVKIANIARTSDGHIALVDANDGVVNGKNGQPLVYTLDQLNAMWNRAHTKTSVLPKGSTMVQSSTDPTGKVTTTPVFTAPDPEDARKGAREDRAGAREERVTTNAEATRKEHMRTQARDAVKNQLFAGQTLMDKVDPAKQKEHGLAAPLAEKYADQGMNPGAAADKAIKEVRDQIKREEKGAGPRGAAAPKAATPTWQDVLD